MAQSTNRSYSLSIISIIVMSLLHMKFLDWSSFNPKEFGFWLAIVNSIIIQLFINFLLKRFWVPDEEKE